MQLPLLPMQQNKKWKPQSRSIKKLSARTNYHHAFQQFKNNHFFLRREQEQRLYMR